MGIFLPERPKQNAINFPKKRLEGTGLGNKTKVHISFKCVFKEMGCHQKRVIFPFSKSGIKALNLKHSSISYIYRIKKYHYSNPQGWIILIIIFYINSIQDRMVRVPESSLGKFY